MKYFSIFLFFGLLFSGIYSCTKPDDNQQVLNCNNGIKDGNETEVDCGGGCDTCPAPATLTCTLGSSSYISTNTFGQILGPSIRIIGNDGRYLNFMFLPGPVNTPISVASANFNYLGEPYAKQDGDSGMVTITAIDTVRKIISGNFYFSGKRLTAITTCAAKNGAFKNVRYGK